MNKGEPFLKVEEWTTAQGQKVRLAYDAEADVMEIAFPGVEGDYSIDLTDQIVLHFNRKEGRASGLTFASYRGLSQPAELGPRSFPLTGLSRAPSTLRATVIRILNTAPVNLFLRTSTLIKPRAKALPILAVERPAQVAGMVA